MKSIIYTDSAGVIKLLETDFDSLTAYKKIVDNQIEPKHSKGWWVFWDMVTHSKTFTFHLPYNVQLFDWEVEELEKKGFGVKWSNKCFWYDVTVYPTKGEE